MKEESPAVGRGTRFDFFVFCNRWARRFRFLVVLAALTSILVDVRATARGDMPSQSEEASLPEKVEETCI